MFNRSSLIITGSTSQAPTPTTFLQDFVYNSTWQVAPWKNPKTDLHTYLLEKHMLKTNHYHHLIWDWNGTLFDDVQLCLDVMNTMLAKRGMPTVSRQQYRRVFDFPVRTYYQKLGYDFKSEPFEAISTEFITAYESQRGSCELMPGAAVAVQAVSQLGLSQSVLSASKEDYLHLALLEYGLADWFTEVYGLDNHHAAGKLDLGMAFMADQKLDPGGVLLVGDTTHDAEVAAAMGIDCWLVPNGHQHLERLAAVGVPIIPDITQVPALLSPSSDPHNGTANRGRKSAVRDGDLTGR